MHTRHAFHQTKEIDAVPAFSQKNCPSSSCSRAQRLTDVLPSSLFPPSEETKKRAKEIRELKAANHRSQLDKQRHKMMQSGASSDEVKRIQLTRAKRIEKRRAKLKAKQKDKLVDVKRMKELKKQNLEKIQRIKEEEKIKKQKQKLQVKMREQALIKKREEEKKKREEEQFKRYLEKMQLEEEKMMAAETAIEKLEREEMELIQMLRATQNDQRNAYEDLENALGEELPGGDA